MASRDTLRALAVLGTIGESILQAYLRKQDIEREMAYRQAVLDIEEKKLRSQENYQNRMANIAETTANADVAYKNALKENVDFEKKVKQEQYDLLNQDVTIDLPDDLNQIFLARLKNLGKIETDKKGRPIRLTYKGKDRELVDTVFKDYLDYKLKVNALNSTKQKSPWSLSTTNVAGFPIFSKINTETGEIISDIETTRRLYNFFKDLGIIKDETPYDEDLNNIFYGLGGSNPSTNNTSSLKWVNPILNGIMGTNQNTNIQNTNSKK